jgi:hypothetical protein
MSRNRKPSWGGRIGGTASAAAFVRELGAGLVAF